MAGSLNKTMLIGNLCADPEVKSFANGGRIANLRIATNESWKDRQTGERKERTEYHSVTIQSEGLVGVVEKYLRKGSKVYVEGQLRTRKWTDQNGNDRYSTEIHVGGNAGALTMLDGPNAGGARGEPSAGSADKWSANNRQADSRSHAGANTSGWGGNIAPDDDDDIPF